MDDIAPQTLHHIESVFFPGSLPGVRSFLTAERIFDIALIKLGGSMGHLLSPALSSKYDLCATFRSKR